MNNVKIETVVTISHSGGATANVVITKDGKMHKSKWTASFHPAVRWTSSNRFANKYRMSVLQKLRAAYSAAKAEKRSIQKTIGAGARRADYRHHKMLPDY